MAVGVSSPAPCRQLRCPPAALPATRPVNSRPSKCIMQLTPLFLPLCLQAQQAHLEGAELPRHLLLQAWTPQTAVLGHPAVKAFITHGGMNRCVCAGSVRHVQDPQACVPYGCSACPTHLKIADTPTPGTHTSGRYGIAFLWLLTLPCALHTQGGASSKVYGALTICACRVIFHTPCPCSTNEGLAAGKPLLCMPFGADQFVNAQHIENKGVGLQVS